MTGLPLNDKAACLLMPIVALALSAASPADKRFQAIWSTEFAWRQAQYIADEPPGTVDPHLPDVSAKSQAARTAYWRDVMRRLDAIDTRALSTDRSTDFQVYRAQIAGFLDDQRFKEWQKPVNGDSAFWSDIQYQARGQFANGLSDYRAYLSQIADIPRYLAQETDNLRLGLARGFTPPAVVMIGRDGPVAAIANATDPTKVIYYEPFEKLPATIPAATQNSLRAEAKAVIANEIIPAHKKLLAFLRTTYFPGLKTDLAATTYPDGAAYYQSRIRAYTTLDMDPAAIHALGLSEVTKIRSEMEAVRQQTGFKGDFKAFLNYLRTDPQFYAKTPDALLKDAAWLAKRFDGIASTWIGHLPRQRFAIRPVPAEIAPYYTAGRGGPSVYLVNTYDLPSRPLYALPALTLHESAPGHAFQIPIAAENKDLPPFRRYSYISAYGEGWALYCERLGQDMGFYRTPYETFGMLSYQMWRAARLVVDTGIHSQGWTRKQAQDFLRDNTALSNQEITTEVDRYIGWPGQALSYYIGELTILKAREKAENALGPKFNIRAFHDTVLKLGSVPMPVLTQRIDQFIADGGRGPYPQEEGQAPEN